jgi:superfamily II DNA or RNA helicase
MSVPPRTFEELTRVAPSVMDAPIRSLRGHLKKSSQRVLHDAEHRWGCSTIGDFLDLADGALPSRPFRHLRKEVKTALLYMARFSPGRANGGNGAAAVALTESGPDAPSSEAASPAPALAPVELARYLQTLESADAASLLAVLRRLGAGWFLREGVNRLAQWGFMPAAVGPGDGPRIDELLGTGLKNLHPRLRSMALDALRTASVAFVRALAAEHDLLEEAARVSDEGKALIDALLELRGRYRERSAPFFLYDASRLRFEADPDPQFVFEPRGWRFDAPRYEVPLDPVGTVRAGHRSPIEAPAHVAIAVLDACLNHLLRQADYRATVARTLREPAWLRPFSRLEELSPPADAQASGELWWQWDPDQPRPVLRVRGKRGRWLKPKRVAVARVANGEVPSATDVDVRIARLLDQIRIFGRNTDPDRVMTEAVEDFLVGHPRIFIDDEFTPVRCSEAELLVELVRGGDHFEPHVVIGEHRLSETEAERWLGPEWFDYPGRQEVRTPDELIFVQVTPAAAFLFREVRRNPPPISAGSELVRRLPSWAGRLPLRMPAGSSVGAENALQVRLSPADPGLDVEVRVRPMTDGPTFTPASGPPTLYRETDDGQIEEVTRDFEAERSAVRALLDDIDPGGALDRERGAGAVRDLEVALALVESLQARPEVDVVWPSQAWSVRTASPPQLNLSLKRHFAEFALDGFVDVDGRRVMLAQLLEAVREERRYVRLDGGAWARLDESLRGLAADLEAASRAPSRKKKGAPPRLVSSFGALAIDRALTAAGSAETDAAFAELLDRIANTRALEPRVPTGLGVELRPYQEQGFRWMSRLAAWGAGACLADDMGLGKTIQALALLASRAPTGPQLVVAPTSVVGNWLAEIQRGSPDVECVRYEGAGRAELVARLTDARTVVLTSYAVLARDAEVLSGVRWTTVVLDEAQAVKNAASIRSKAVRDLQSDFRIALTGTPVENDLGELWALFEFLVPGLLGDEKSFRARFKDTDDPALDAARSASLARLVEPFILRRTKRDVAPELPPRTELVRRVELSDAERELYAAVQRAAVDHLAALDVGTDVGTARFRILAWMTRLRQLACHPRLYDPRSRLGSSKHEALLELVRELVSEGRRALVFSQFVKQLDLVQASFEAEGIAFERLDGKTPRAERERRVAAFMSGSAPVFLVSLKAGGTGLNLTAADTVVHLDPWWNPAVEDQATDRVHRIGQTDPVTVVRLVSEGTIEASILAMHDRKRALADRVLAGTDAAARLNNEQLAALITGGAR